LHKKFPELPISIDGTVNKNTAKRLVDAGATRLVAGSAILESGDVHSAMEELKSLVE
jgi:pentose-5-phosphate-3-epimerase